ncbi:MAG: enoyl-CoA hydratase/isomerase family protein [Acidobacteriota bacterium]|nr:MAG: enoyl-CoA hydratase/isomerase family protein [Acidobacteriota bacterium]
MSDFLSKEVVDDALILRFTRPEIRNPLSRAVVERLHEIVDGLDSIECRRVVFTGSGDAFASGANLKEIAALTAEEAPEFALLGQSLMQKIDKLPQLVIAAINGHCFGGALDLALACDRRIASPNATFCHPGAGLGIITGWSGTQRLPRLVGTANALEMFFTASPIGAERALNIGLVDVVAFDVVAQALKTLR